MKSLYLIFAATAVVTVCEAQHTNNDIIWYPVDDEEGIFISTYGEKYRTTPNTKGRSHRRARYSGMNPAAPLPLSYDPTENRDPSFFHDINERRPPPLPHLAVPAFFIEHVPPKRPHKRPPGHEKPSHENFQEIFNEVFDYNKYPPSSENPGGRPGTTGQWSSRPENQNQMVGPTNGNNNERPGNQWESISQPFPQRPSTNRPGSTRPVQRPPSSEWINTSRPSSISTSQSDKLIFPDEDWELKSTSMSVTTPTPISTTSNLIPTDPPTMSPCERLCPVTPEFNPVCGTDGVTYSNAGRLKCANMCGKNVGLSHYGNCGRTPFSTPLVSNTPRQKFAGFWLVNN